VGKTPPIYAYPAQALPRAPRIPSYASERFVKRQKIVG